MMTNQEHDEIMTNIMKQLEKENLDLGDGISIWHSLGLFLFSNIDRENKDINIIYNTMQNYLNEMKEAKTSN